MSNNLPIGWKKELLEKVGSIVKGKVAETFDIPDDSTKPYIGVESFDGRYTRFTKVASGPDCEPEDILILWDGERAGLCATGLKGIIGSTVARLRLKDEFHSKYIYYQLTDKFNWIQARRTGTGVPHVPKDLPRILELSIPESWNEQKLIAQILDILEQGIYYTGQIIAKLKQIKAGLLHDLLTRGLDENGELRDPVAHPEQFKDSPLGRIPREWEVMVLADVLLNVIDHRGKTPLKISMKWGGGDIPALSANNVEMGQINLNKETYYGSLELYKRWMTTGDAAKGDLVMTLEAPLGNVALIPDDRRYILSQRVVLFKTKREIIDNKFLYYQLMSDRFQRSLFLEATGTTAIGIQRAKLEQLLIVVPMRMEEQEEIASRLGNVDTRIRAEEAYTEKLQSLKAGLMHDLLTGKVRVPLDEEGE